MARLPKYYKVHTDGCDVALEPIYIELFPVVHARWIVYGDWAECSHCHEASKLYVMDHKDYCPACGASMDEESVVIPL